MELDAPFKGIEWVDDVMSGRDDPENLKILKKTWVEVRPLKFAVGFFGSDQIWSV